MAGIYIHIPFCKSRCIYCDFYSTTRLEEREKYTVSLVEEIRTRSKENVWKNEVFHTIYFGGGTPSQLTPQQIQRITDELYENFRIADDAEFTIEVNPDDINTSLLTSHISHLNRISMGVQSFNDERLKLIGRRHNAQQARDAVRICKEAGIENTSIDLMFGFPGETLEEWENDIEEALKLRVQHISAYSLMYEQGTRLTQMLNKGEIQEIDEELSNRMYELLCNKLKQAGYEHYEISNFALTGFRSRHNSSYWANIPYIGLGAGAHSFDGNVRSWNGEMLNGSYKKEGEETPNTDEQYNERVMTRLRTCEGICLSDIEKEFGKHYFDHLMKQSKPHIMLDNLRIDGGNTHISLTEKGILTSNQIMSDLMI